MRGKILIVDDYGDWRELLTGLLDREGYQVRSLGTLREATDYIGNNNDLDLAIVDIRLMETDDNNEDGLTLLAEINDQMPFTQVIMITGYGTMETQRKAFRKFQAFDFIQKSEFDADVLRKNVKEAIEKSQRERLRWNDQTYMHGHRFENWRKEKKKT